MRIFEVIRDWGKRLLNILPKITTEIFIYGIGGSLAQFFAVGSLMVITRVLSSSEYGSVDVINAATGYFATLITLNITVGLMRHFFEVPEHDPKERIKLVSSLVWFIVIFGGLIVFIGSLFSSKISILLFSTPEHSLDISLALACLPFIALKNIFTGILQMKHQPLRYLVINILYGILNILLIVLFVVILGFNVTGIFLAQLVTSVIMMAASGWQIRDLIRLVFSLQWFRRMAAYGIPMMPGSLFQWAMLSINRLLLTQYTTTAQIGYYSLASRPAKIIELAVTSFNLAWQPIFLANINSETFHGKLNRALRYYIFTALLLSACVTAYGREIIYILAPAEYQVAVVMVGLLCLRQAIFGTDFIVAVGVVQTKKTIYISISLGAGVASMVGISLLLMPAYGIYGAVIADIIGQLVSTSLNFIFSNRLKKIHWSLKPVLFSISGFLMLWLLTIVFAFPNPWLDILYRTLLLGLFFTFILLGLDRGEIIRNVLASIRKNTDQFDQQVHDIESQVE